MDYFYSIIRYVPDDVRDEGINIGVAMECRRLKKIVFTYVNDYTRAAAIDPYFSKSAVERVIHYAKESISNHAEVRGSLDDLIVIFTESKIKFTPSQRIVTEDTVKTLRDLGKAFLYDSIKT